MSRAPEMRDAIESIASAAKRGYEIRISTCAGHWYTDAVRSSDPHPAMAVATQVYGYADGGEHEIADLCKSIEMLLESLP